MALPKLPTESHVLLYHVNSYYKTVTEDPSIRLPSRHHEHVILIEDLNNKYVRTLMRDESPRFDDFFDAFLDNIEFLAQVSKKAGEREALEERKKKFRQLLD